MFFGSRRASCSLMYAISIGNFSTTSYQRERWVATTKISISAMPSGDDWAYWLITGLNSQNPESSSVLRSRIFSSGMSSSSSQFVQFVNIFWRLSSDNSLNNSDGISSGPGAFLRVAFLRYSLTSSSVILPRLSWGCSLTISLLGLLLAYFSAPCVFPHCLIWKCSAANSGLSSV